MDPIGERLSKLPKEELQHELKKCEDSPAYFYNTYIRKEGEMEVSEEEFNRIREFVKKVRNTPGLVVGRSEQLKAFRDWARENLDEKDIVTQDAIDSYLQSL